MFDPVESGWQIQYVNQKDKALSQMYETLLVGNNKYVAASP